MTGASSGLGDALRPRAPRRRRPGRRRPPVAPIGSSGSPPTSPTSVVVAADVADEDDRERLVATTLEHVRPGRRPRQQRRHRRQDGPRGRAARPLPLGDGGQRHRHRGTCASCSAPSMIADGGGSDRQRRLDARPRRLDAGQAGPLLRQQGRRRQPHPRAGAAVARARASRSTRCARAGSRRR